MSGKRDVQGAMTLAIGIAAAIGPLLLATNAAIWLFKTYRAEQIAEVAAMFIISTVIAAMAFYDYFAEPKS